MWKDDTTPHARGHSRNQKPATEMQVGSGTDMQVDMHTCVQAGRLKPRFPCSGNC